MVDKHPNAPRGHQVSTGWPAWRYGPDDQAAIFQTEADVPVGWCSKQDRSDPKEAPPVAEEAVAPAQVFDVTASEAVEIPVPERPRRPLTLKRTPG